MNFDLVILGGGTGGVAAALAATDLGLRVALTETVPWLGGQFTSQAVPPDEHPWIETTGCTRRYRALRDGIRTYYRTHRKLTANGLSETHLNPGSGWVSHLAHEPRVCHSVLMEMLAPAIRDGRLTVFQPFAPLRAEMNGSRIEAIHIQNLVTGEELRLGAPIYLDATELGDVLPITGTEYVTGAESRAETGEPHAPEIADPTDHQAFTWCFALGFERLGNRPMPEPADYHKWRSFVPQLVPPWPGRLLSWTVSDVRALSPRTFSLFGEWSMFTYRQIVDTTKVADVPFDSTIVNWAQNDCLANVIDVAPTVATQALHDSRQLSLSLAYWLKTEAERHDKGYGYPELFLDGSTLGTEDGLAQAPYFRESRRIRALQTITELHVGVEARPGASGAHLFADSCGIGAYRIDLHPSTGGRNSLDLGSFPFQIPLGALVPVRVENLLAAGKNIGTTHITNGCYRLHPVEWNIGEAAATLAHWAIQHSTSVQEAYSRGLADIQATLQRQGVPLTWDIETHPL